jgi:hypothetical protein
LILPFFFSLMCLVTLEKDLTGILNSKEGLRGVYGEGGADRGEVRISKRTRKLKWVAEVASGSAGWRRRDLTRWTLCELSGDDARRNRRETRPKTDHDIEILLLMQ